MAYGNESAVVYSVTLGSATPVPTGTVTVATGTTTLCTVTLTAGAGSCAITSPTLLAVSATNPVVATYTGDVNYSGSVSSTASVNLAVVRAPTTTGFVLSTSVVSYGGESATTITATVTPGFTYGTATGIDHHPHGRHHALHHHPRLGVGQRRILLARPTPHSPCRAARTP